MMKSKKQTQRKIFIADCQVFQEPAWHRGMGKYSIALLEEMAANASFSKEYSLKLLLNSNLPKDEDMLNQVKKRLPKAEIIWQALPLYKEGKSLVEIQNRCKALLDELVSKKFKEEDTTFVIMSLFLQFACPVYPESSKKVLLYYDLIMLQYYQMYLGLGASEQHFAHYRTLFESDLILSISKTVANDLTLYLGIPKENIENIDGAPIKRKNIHPVKPSVGLTKKFILMPSGGDPRKNNHRAVQGFNEFNNANGKGYSLVLTSSFGKGMQKELEKLSTNTIFTGNIEEAELAWLYENCEIVLFAPEYEGLGMPILEAADYGKPVACSDISVFREISPSAYYYFDHTSPSDIARSLNEIVNDTEFENRKSEYDAILEEYSWHHTATKATTAIISHAKNAATSKKRIAVVSPNLQTNSYASYIAALQYPSHMKNSNLDFYYDFSNGKNAVRPNHLAFSTDIHPVTDFDAIAYKQYETVKYYLDDRDDSPLIAAKASALSGDVYLFSSNIANLYKEMVKREIISTSRYNLEKKISHTLGGEQHFLGSLLNSSEAVFASKQIKKQIDQSLKKLKQKAAEVFNDKDLLPTLPYKIPEAKTNSSAILYVSSSIAKEEVKELEKVVNDNMRLKIVFGNGVSESCSATVVENIDHVSVFYSPTDFQLISLIQKSTQVNIFSKKNDLEGIFISARCHQLGKQSKTINPKNGLREGA